MKIKLVLMGAIITLSMVLSSCAGMADGGYDLPGEYSIWFINASTVELCRDQKEDGKVWGQRRLWKHMYRKLHIMTIIFLQKG